MRLNPKGIPYPLHGGFRQPSGIRHRPTAPLRLPAGRAAQGLVDQGGDPLFLDLTRPPGAQLVIQPVQSPLDEASTPFANTLAAEADLFGNCDIPHPIAGQKDELGAKHKAMRQTAGLRKRLYLLTGVSVHFDGSGDVSRCHRRFSLPRYDGSECNTILILCTVI